MKIRLYNVIVILALASGTAGWAEEPTGAPAAKPIDLAVISNSCGELRYTVDPSDLRPKDIDILRQILSYVENGKHELFTYPGQPDPHQGDAILAEQPDHQGPSKAHVLKLVQDPVFAGRAGQEWLAGLKDYPENQLGDNLVQKLEARFSIQEVRINITDANCHPEDHAGEPPPPQAF